MMVLAIFGGALLVLAYWAAILWLGARADRSHLERERIQKVFGERRP
ncbi:hypothetical protein [Sphingosinicella sp. YJ22]|nr:hypothetical protein [Sphingosinicella sp. YJ22]